MVIPVGSNVDGSITSLNVKWSLSFLRSRVNETRAGFVVSIVTEVACIDACVARGLPATSSNAPGMILRKVFPVSVARKLLDFKAMMFCGERATLTAIISPTSTLVTLASVTVTNREKSELPKLMRAKSMLSVSIGSLNTSWNVLSFRSREKDSTTGGVVSDIKS